MGIHCGGPVSGEERFPRTELQKLMIQRIETGPGVKLFGLRRTGKSTMLRCAGETMAGRGYNVVEVDAQGMHSVDRLLFGVFEALPKNCNSFADRVLDFAGREGAVPEVVRTVFKKLKTGDLDKSSGEDMAAYWPIFSNQIVRVLKEDNPRLVLCVDELPFLLQNIIRGNPDDGPQRVDQLLAALREWRNAGLKMVLAGSIGIIGLARKYKFSADHLNDLSVLEVPELSESEALEFIQWGTRSSMAWTQAPTQALLEEIGSLYPSFLAKSLAELNPNDPPSPEEIPDIFASRIRPEFHDTFLSQFNKRYRLYEEIDTSSARELIVPILKAVLAEKNGCPQTKLEELDCKAHDRVDMSLALEMLREDGFLSYTEDRDGNRIWRPASRLVILWGRNLG